jgi:CDK inhibitor PHO81
MACARGHLDIAELLLDSGAKILYNSEGLQPIHIVSRAGHTGFIKLLLQHGSNLEARDKFSGWTPIFFAASEGHVEILKELIDHGALTDVRDEDHHSPTYHAAWEGHKDALQVLLSAGGAFGNTESTLRRPVGPVTAQPQDESMDDGIPSLTLPPPILPVRSYGHNYLDKSTFVQIILCSPTKNVRSPVQWYLDESLFSSSKMTISLKSAQRRSVTELIPHTVSLPIMDDAESLTFQIDEIDTIFLEFEIYPTFGSKVIAKGVALPSMFKGVSSSRTSGRQCIIPLLDPRLQPIGHVSFDFTIIRPFAGVHFDIHSRIETYWKSTQTFESGGKAASQHLVTESSLSGQYLWVPVQVTSDHVAFVAPIWHLPVANVTLGVMDVTAEQLMAISSAQQGTVLEQLRAAQSPEDLRQLLQTAIIKLDDFLEHVQADINVHIQIMYPSAKECIHLGLKTALDINIAVDSVLSTVFSVSDRRKAEKPQLPPRSLFFSSCNATICTAMNWKQPNYPVFLASHVGLSSPTSADVASRHTSPHGLALTRRSEECSSIKEAVKFSRINNLLGMIIDADIALHAPALITTIKESGLVLITHGSANVLRQNVDTQAAHGADGIFFDGVCSFLHGIET